MEMQQRQLAMLNVKNKKRIGELNRQKGTTSSSSSDNNSWK